MTPEQAALVRKAQESLEAARLLAERGFHGFAVSRAYYAMFYLAEALLLAEHLTFSRHAAVIAAFGQHFARTGRVPAELHRYLIEAQSSRNVGDYDAASNLSASHSSEQLARAAGFLEVALSLLGRAEQA